LNGSTLTSLFSAASSVVSMIASTGLLLIVVLFLLMSPEPIVRGLLSGEAAVPLSAVSQVRQRRFFDRLVTVTFSRDTDVGTRVVFLPRARPRLAIWREDDVVGELREAARRATASSR